MLIVAIVCGFMGYRRIAWFWPGLLAATIAAATALYVNGERERLGLNPGSIPLAVLTSVALAYVSWGIGYLIALRARPKT